MQTVTVTLWYLQSCVNGVVSSQECGPAFALMVIGAGVLLLTAVLLAMVRIRVVATNRARVLGEERGAA